MWKKKAIVLALVVALAMAWDQYILPNRELATHFLVPGLIVAGALWVFGRLGVSPYLRAPLALAAEPAVLLLLLAAALVYVGSPRLFEVGLRLVIIATIIVELLAPVSTINSSARPSRTGVHRPRSLLGVAEPLCGNPFDPIVDQDCRSRGDSSSSLLLQGFSGPHQITNRPWNTPVRIER